MNNTVEDITLTLFKIGSDKTNYNILKILPNKISTIMDYTNLTKVPVNNRANKLEMCGLVERNRGTGEVFITNLGNEFMGYIQDTMSTVSNDKKQFINRFVNQ